MHTAGDATMGFVLLGFMALLYFIPAMVAYSKGHRNKLGVLFLNFFLGWSLIGWVVALIWSVWNSK